MSLPVAVSDDGYKLYHSLEWCKKENIVLVYDNQLREWLRGKGMARFRCMPTYKEPKDKELPFPAGEKMQLTIDDKDQVWAEDGAGRMFKVKIVNV